MARRYSRRSFFKNAAGLTTATLLVDRAAGSAHAYRTYLPFDPETDTHHGYRYGTIQHHRPEFEPTGEKFVPVRLKYPGGDWYTNIVDYYRWPSDLKFAQVLNDATSIDVALYEHPQYVSVDDEDLFAYPYLLVTGHVGVDFSEAQTRKLGEYLERGGFLHVEDCDIRLNRGRGFMRSAIHRLMKQIFPDKKFERIDLSHPIYHTLYDHNEYLGGDKLVYPYGIYDDALILDGRVAVYFCPSDLNCAWEGRPCYPGGEEQRQWAFEQGMNAVAYALSR